MNKSTKLNFSGQGIYVGLDTHLKNWRVTIFVGETFYKIFSQDPNPITLLKYLKRNFPNGDYYSAYEASFCGYKIHRDLLRLGIKNMVINPADIPTTDKERKQKEDSRDSHKIAKQLSQNALTPIYVPTIEVEGDRQLIRYRKMLTKELSRTKNRVKSHLYYHGIEIPSQFSGKKYWSKKFIEWLKNLEFETESSKKTLEGHLEMAEMLRKRQYLTNKEIRKLSNKICYKENCELLISVPGIGLLTSMLFLTEIEEIGRFKKLDKLCSYIGLVPMTNSTGENEKVGDITVRQNKFLRSAIVESAWIALRYDPALMLAYQKLISRMQPQEAIIRIAKKLLNRILYVLKNKKKYEPYVVK